MTFNCFLIHYLYIVIENLRFKTNFGRRNVLKTNKMDKVLTFVLDLFVREQPTRNRNSLATACVVFFGSLKYCTLKRKIFNYDYSSINLIFLFKMSLFFTYFRYRELMRKL